MTRVAELLGASAALGQFDRHPVGHVVTIPVGARNAAEAQGARDVYARIIRSNPGLKGRWVAGFERIPGNKRGWQLKIRKVKE